MSKPANTVAIGAFVTGAVAILITLLFLLSGNAFRGNMEYSVLLFDGSVKGLKVGAPVAFKGVNIGQVTAIDLVLDTDTYQVMMPVTVRINEDKVLKTGANKDEDSMHHLLKRGMRGQLKTQSLLTGLLYIQLDFHPESDLNYFDYETELVQIPTIPTDMERLSRNLEDLNFDKLFREVESSIAGLNTLINNPESQSLTGNLNQTLLAVQQLSETLNGQIETLSPQVEQLLTHSDETVQLLNGELPQLTDSADAALIQLNATLAAAQVTLGNVDYTLSDDSAVLYDIRQAANELTAAGRALQALAETLETQPESLLKGKSPLGN